MNTFTAPQLQKMSENFDPEILNQIRKGDQKAINLVKRPLKKITINLLKYYVIRNTSLAGEIVSDVFTEMAFRKIPFPPHVNVMAYLRTLSRNLICRHLRDNRGAFRSEEDLANFLDINPIIDSAIPMWELQEIIDVCMSLLHEQERMLIEGILEEKSVDELIFQLGYKNKEVFYTRKSIVVAKFRGLLREHDVDL